MNSTPIHYCIEDSIFQTMTGEPYIRKFATLAEATEYVIKHNSLYNTITAVRGSLKVSITVNNAADIQRQELRKAKMAAKMAAKNTN